MPESRAVARRSSLPTLPRSNRAPVTAARLSVRMPTACRGGVRGDRLGYCHADGDALASRPADSATPAPRGGGRRPVVLDPHLPPSLTAGPHAANQTQRHPL